MLTNIIKEIKLLKKLTKEIYEILLTGIIIGFLIGSLSILFIYVQKIFLGKIEFKSFVELLKENLAFETISVFLFFNFIAWGLYIIFLGIYPRLLCCQKYFVRISKSFVSYASGTLGISISVSLSSLILSTVKADFVKTEIPQIKLELIPVIITMCFLVFIPNGSILEKFKETTIKEKYLPKINNYKSKFYNHRFFVSFLGACYVIFPSLILGFFLLNQKRCWWIDKCIYLNTQ
jgi:hypothetical protein